MLERAAASTVGVWRTTVFRLVSVSCVLFAVGVVALLGLVYAGAAHGLNARADETLKLELASLLPSTPEALPGRIQAQLAQNVSRNTHLALFSATGARVAGDLARLPPDLKADVPPREIPDSGQGPMRAVAVTTPWGETLVIGRDAGPLRQVRAVILHALIGSGALIASVGLVLATLLSISPLRRLRELETASRLIAAGRLDLRMPISGRRDELDLFAATVNAMVAEIERLLDEVRSVTDAAAHDLRTPLTHVRLDLDRLARSKRRDGSVRTALERAIAELDEVLERFAALLRIAQVESRARRAGFAPVDLAGLVAQAVELYEPLAEEAGVGLRAQVEAGAVVEADGKLLFEALGNLVDNAIKFSGAGGDIVVRLAPGAGGPELSVEDDGPGIAAEERAAVLQRFHRGPASGAVPGSGLGLSLVAAIARLHRFELRLEPAHPGLAAVLACGAPPLG